MPHLLTITDALLGLDVPAPVSYRERPAVRAVVFDADGRVALMHAAKTGYYKLPGGGIEEGEDAATALARELLEETGCSVSVTAEIGTIEEYRNEIAMHQVSTCFIAELAGEKGEPQLTDKEVAEGFEVVWLGLEEALDVMADESHAVKYGGKFMRLRDHTFLKECARLKEKPTRPEDV